jgi:hypothetical protein
LTWRYRAGANRFDVTPNGIAFWLPGLGYLRSRHLSWSDVLSFAPQLYSEPGLSRDKGAGRKFGSARAWRISLQRPHQRPIGLPVIVPDRYSEERVLEWATLMNLALALPRSQADLSDP